MLELLTQAIFFITITYIGYVLLYYINKNRKEQNKKAMEAVIEAIGSKRENQEEFLMQVMGHAAGKLLEGFVGKYNVEEDLFVFSINNKRLNSKYVIRISKE